MRGGVRVGFPRVQEHVREPPVRRGDVLTLDVVPDVRLEILVPEPDRSVLNHDTWREPGRERGYSCLADIQSGGQRAQADGAGEREHQGEPPLPAGVGAADAQG